MAIDSQLLDWFNTTVTLENANGSSSGGYGGRTYATAVSVIARAEPYVVRTRSHEGTPAVTKGRLFLAPFCASGTSASVTVTPKDRITLPSSDFIRGAGRQPRIIDVSQQQDEYGATAFFEVLI